MCVFLGACTTIPVEKQHAVSEGDRALDCRQIRGRMKVRIAQIHGNRSARRTTALSRGLQGAFGTNKYGVNPDQQNLDDIAQLKTYNKLLAEKKCKTYDLEKELKPRTPSVAQGTANKSSSN